VIPPTPNSIELHGGAARYPQRVDASHEMYDRYGQMSEEQVRDSVPSLGPLTGTNEMNDPQAAFYTPLVSPAMTPLESQFRLPEYTIPGEYFTPLTSPALEAQNSSNGYPYPATQPPSAGYVPSPIDQNGMSVTSAPSSPGILRKQRRRPSVAKRTGGRAAKASPSIQPKNRRKQALSAQLLADDISHTLGQDQGAARPPTSAGSSLRYGSQESSQDSVSPEPISEPLMPPPALPQVRKSPAMGPQITDPKSNGPATPAMLMRIQNRPQHLQSPAGQFSGFASLVTDESQDELMEDMVLPEAANNTRPRLSRIDTSLSTKHQPAALSAKSTPTIEPRSDRPPSGSLTPGPPSGSMASPSGPVPKKSESKGSGNRKRQSVSSSHVSPALRPRISPSIQPLVRGEGQCLSFKVLSIYLPTKSNHRFHIDRVFCIVSCVQV
jgi:hypothetical protein